MTSLKNTVAFGYIQTRLTRSKESGAYAIHNGERIAIGIPGAGGPQGANRDIPLQGRGGTPTEAAMSILALASPLMSYMYVTGHTLVSLHSCMGYPIANLSLRFVHTARNRW